MKEWERNKKISDRRQIAEEEEKEEEKKKKNNKKEKTQLRDEFTW